MSANGSPTVGVRSVQRTARRPERGYVAITTAIMMILLLAFAALGIDVAIWYTRGQQIQRAADAAALAGVTRMPRFTTAVAAAQDVAVRNRFKTSDITVEKVAGSPREIRVRVTDPNVPSFFGKFLRNSTSITREARAEFLSEIELGSKLNALGTGPIPGMAPNGGAQNFWLAINGYCVPKEDGDRFASAFDGNRTATDARCDQSNGFAMKNTEYTGDYQATGRPSYSYIVDVPCPTANEDPCVTPRTSDVHIASYSPFYDPSNLFLDTNIINPTTQPALFDSVQVTTLFTLLDENGTILDGPRVFATCPITGCSWNENWYPIFTIPAAAGAGRFRVEVSTLANQTTSFGVNVFGLIAYPSTQGLGPCITAGCPSLSGAKSMSVYANVSGGSSEFYLAKLAPAKTYRGKRVQIQLWDPGEGADSIQVLAPNASSPTLNAPIGFQYRTWAPGLEAIDSNPASVADLDRIKTTTVGPDHKLPVAGLVTALPASQQTPWNPSQRVNASTFNGRLVSIEVNIPTNYGCVPASSPCVEAPLPDDGWWKIRYNTSGGVVSDRATWTVQLVGDPVHLVQQ